MFEKIDALFSSALISQMVSERIAYGNNLTLRGSISFVSFIYFHIFVHLEELRS